MPAESFGKYDYHQAADLCREAADLAREAREKLHAAHALFRIDEDQERSAEKAVEAEALGIVAGNLWVRAADLGYM